MEEIKIIIIITFIIYPFNMSSILLYEFLKISTDLHLRCRFKTNPEIFFVISE